MRHPVITASIAVAACASLAFGPGLPQAPPAASEAEVAAGGFTNGPVEHVATIPLDAGNGFGSTVHDDLLIVTGPRGVTLYDTEALAEGVTTPLGTVELPGTLFAEEPRTDGERLLVQDDFRTQLYIIDISDPTAPALKTTYEVEEHLWACVFDDCSIVYGSFGTILDITDVSNPVQLGDWTELPGVELSFPEDVRQFHAIEQVAPGIVLTGTEPLYLLDARADAATPTLLASGRMDEPGMIQGQLPVPGNTPRYAAARVQWPTRTTPLSPDATDPGALLPQHERWGVVSVETPLASDCAEGSGALLSFDFDRVEEDGTFTVVDELRITTSGTYTDGLAPAHTTGCFPYAFSLHPRYTETRLAAVAWTEHGMRLVQVRAEDGHLEEEGWFIGVGGNASDAEWLADDLIAVVDVARGIDIVRVDLEDYGAGA